jgi:hypothetical protein
MPPCIISDPGHKKPFMIFSMDLRNDGGSSVLIVVYIEMATSVVLIKVNRPLQCMNFPFHTGSLLAIWSARGCSTDLGSLLVHR